LYFEYFGSGTHLLIEQILATYGITSTKKFKDYDGHKKKISNLEKQNLQAIFAKRAGNQSKKIVPLK